MEKKPKIIAILGATASGKSALGVALTQEFSGEIVSADSRQVYRGLDIGTAKITPLEMAGVTHHLIDVADLSRHYTAFDFQMEAIATLSDISTRGHLPIVVGGTFFYTDLLRGRTGTAKVVADADLRQELGQKTLPELVDLLSELDPDSLATIDTLNPRRLIRAIEVVKTLGTRPKAEKLDSPYDWLVIGLSVDKTTLRTRYRARATNWLANGFLAEVEGLLRQGIDLARLQEIGFEYTLGLDLLKHRITEAEFIDRFEQKNWQYAKRQLTWLKRDETICWFKPEATAEIFASVRQFLHN